MINEFQQSLLEEMGKALDQCASGALGLGSLVETLRGLYSSADFHDDSLRTKFEGAWVGIDHENELRTESWAPPGEATQEKLDTAIERMRSWIALAMNS